MIVVGLVREVLGDLPKYDPHTLPGTYPIGAARRASSPSR